MNFKPIQKLSVYRTLSTGEQVNVGTLTPLDHPMRQNHKAISTLLHLGCRHKKYSMGKRKKFWPHLQRQAVAPAHG